MKHEIKKHSLFLKDYFIEANTTNFFGESNFKQTCR